MPGGGGGVRSVASLQGIISGCLSEYSMPAGIHCPVAMVIK